MESQLKVLKEQQVSDSVNVGSVNNIEVAPKDAVIYY